MHRFALLTSRIFEIDGLRLFVVHDLGDLYPFGQEFRALRLQRRHRARLKSKVIKRAGHPEPAIDPRIIFCRDPWYPACLHEGKELIASGIKEDVPDLPAFFDLDDVATHRLEAQDVLVEVARLIQIYRSEPAMGNAFV